MVLSFSFGIRYFLSAFICVIYFFPALRVLPEATFALRVLSFSAAVWVCVRMCVSICVNLRLVRAQNSSPVQASTTNSERRNLRFQIYPILTLSAPKTHPLFNLQSPKWHQRCKTPWLKSLLFGWLIDADFSRQVWNPFFLPTLFV